MDGTRLIVAGSFIDGSGGEVRRNVFFAVKDTMITAIGQAADLSPGDRAAIEDFSHCTILPALIDCSVSLSRSPSVDKRVRLAYEEAGLVKRRAMLEQHIRYCHIHGVLGVADSDDKTGLVDLYLKGIAPGEGIVDICTSGQLCRSRQEWAAGNSAVGDFLKIAYSGNIEEGEYPHLRFSPEELQRILQSRSGKKAVVVANGLQQVREALEAGCDAIEQGYAMGEDNLRKMAEKNILWIPSLQRAKNAMVSAGAGGKVGCRFSLGYVTPGKAGPGGAAFWKKMLAGHLAQLRLARKLGVTTVVGTGAGSVGILHGESMVEEMKLFIKGGYSLPETIRCASKNGAGFFGLEKLGTLSVGKKATFLITRGMVQQLPRKLSYLEGIYVDGEPSLTYRKNPVKAP